MVAIRRSGGDDRRDGEEGGMSEVKEGLKAQGECVARAVAWLTNVKGLAEEEESVLTGGCVHQHSPYASAFRVRQHSSPSSSVTLVQQRGELARRLPCQEQGSTAVTNREVVSIVDR